MKKKSLILALSVFILPMLEIKTANAYLGEDTLQVAFDTTGDWIDAIGETTTSGKYAAGVATGALLYPVAVYALRKAANPAYAMYTTGKNTIQWFFTNPLGTAMTASAATAAAATGLYLATHQDN
jgi:hypothetical protein